MRPDPRFTKKPMTFWACVRSLSQHLGYSKRNSIIVPSLQRMASAFSELSLDPTRIVNNGRATSLARQLEEYFFFRADRLTRHVEPNLLTAIEARRLFIAAKKEWNPKCPLPMNKQKGDKRAEAFLTCLVNILVEAHSDGLPCIFDPRELTTITRGGQPIRTLARRVDGAFPSTVNPIAVWEVKEYYYTTTFGSRIADGVYESLLDGIELEELRQNENIDVKHYLMVDAYRTWWLQGKSYLCRVIDMLHMQYVDEVLFGREVVDELPKIVQGWVKLARALRKQSRPTSELL